MSDWLKFIRDNVCATLDCSRHAAKNRTHTTTATVAIKSLLLQSGASFTSGAGTNLKVGGTSSKRRKKCFWSWPLHLLALKLQLVVLVSAFETISTVWSVSCLLFFDSWYPPCPAICKNGGHVPPVPHGVGTTECDLHPPEQTGHSGRRHCWSGTKCGRRRETQRFGQSSRHVGAAEQTANRVVAAVQRWRRCRRRRR